MCRRDHGITWDEFQTLTLANIEALEYRRNLELRHARFNAGVVAASTINVNLMPDAKRVSPFDFVPGFEDDDAEDEHRRTLKRTIAQIFLRDAKTLTPESAQALKQKLIQKLRDQGITDAVELFAEVFPEL